MQESRARKRLSRLISFRSIPGFLAALFRPFIWLVDRVAEAQFLHDNFPSAVAIVDAAITRAEYISTLWITVSGFLWLGVLILWPDIMERLAVRLGETEVLLRVWRPLTKSEISNLAERLAAIGKRTILITHNDAIDCSDLAEDFTEAFQRAGWSLPRKPGVSWGSIGARGISLRGKPNETLCFSIAKAINDATYITPEIGEPLAEKEQEASTEERPTIKNPRVPIDALLAVAPMRRKPRSQLN